MFSCSELYEGGEAGLFFEIFFFSIYTFRFMVKHASIGFTPYGFTMSSETNGLLLDVRFDFNLVHFVGIIISHVSDTILVKKKKRNYFQNVQICWYVPAGTVRF